MLNASSDPSGCDSLTNSRARLFSLLLMRLRALHANRSIPRSYFLGQEYFGDHARADCTIAFMLLYPGHVEQVKFWFHRTNVSVTQSGNKLVVNAYRKISVRLWNDLRLLGVGGNFIIGYIKSLLPQINRRLLDNRYERGYLLSRTFAIFEVTNVSITVDNKRIWLNWPQSTLPFPPTMRLSGQISALFLRDYIDSIDAFFRNEYDDCVRRVITSTENFIEAKKWKVKPTLWSNMVNFIRKVLCLRRRSSRSFRRILNENLDSSLISDRVMNENLQYVYTIRNKIVHNGYRMEITSGLFCDKSICSMYYLISRHSGDPQLSRDVRALHKQFTDLKGFLGEMCDLDEIERIIRNPATPIAFINGPAAREHFMFDALRFTEADKRSI